MRSVKFKVWIVECKVSSVECKVWSVAGGGDLVVLVVMLLCWLVVSLWIVAQVPSLRRYERTMYAKKVRFPIAEVCTRSPRTWIHSGSWLPSCFCLHDQFFVLCTCWVLTQNWYLHFESAGATPRLRALSRESSRQPWRRHVWESWGQDQCELLPGASENSVFPSLKDYPRGNQWWFKVVHTLGQHGISIYK